MADVTVLLARAQQGDEHARNELAPLVYKELKKLASSHMRRERQPGGMQATVLVSDVFMRLVGNTPIDWENRSHFYGIASRAMRQILVDNARAQHAMKRGDGAIHVEFDEVVTVSPDRNDHVLAVEEALKSLEAINPQHAEIVTMRFFAGMSMDEVAKALNISKRTADREWVLIKAWLRRELAA